MLSTDDVDLIGRDGALPGLRLVLDSQSVAAVMRGALPDARLDSLEITYVKYKPATSCLVAFRARAGSRSVDLYAHALRREEAGKLRKRRSPSGPSSSATDDVLLDDFATRVSFFPNDRCLRSLARIGSQETQRALMRRVFRQSPERNEVELRTLRYKPERRYVAQALIAGRAEAVVKFYDSSDFDAAKAAAKSVRSHGALRVARRVGGSKRHRIVALEWLSGRLLANSIDDSSAGDDDFARVGLALAEWHSQSAALLPRRTQESSAASLADLADGIAFLCPSLDRKIRGLQRTLAAWLGKNDNVSVCPVHGDFDASQVLLSEEHVGVLDFDNAHRGDAAEDLGNFLAHCTARELQGGRRSNQVVDIRDALVRGYRERMPAYDARRVDGFVAVSLLRLAPHPFRRRESDWSARIESIVDRASAMVEDLATRQASRAVGGRCSVRSRDDANVEDRLGAAADAGMPMLAAALEPGRVEAAFRAAWAAFDARHGRVRAIRVLRHKPARRCLIEYEIALGREGDAEERLTVLGKMRAKGCDEPTFRLSEMLWRKGFRHDSQDGVSVPEPVAVVPRLHMWLQRKAPGVEASRLVAGDGGTEVIDRVVRGIHKLHRLPLPIQKRHTIDDELGLLERRLRDADVLTPWQRRVDELLDGCRRLAQRMGHPTLSTIHRDFYADQVMVDGDRIHLLDLDLCCLGDPALDIGNFRGHLIIHSLKHHGRADALANQEAVLEQSFERLAGRAAAVRARAYTSLTLVRHLHISTLFADRRGLIEPLLDACEDRMTYHE